MTGFIRYRKIKEVLHRNWMLLCLAVIILIPLAITLGLVFRSSFLLREHSLFQLLFSSVWKPENRSFGFLPFIISSLWVSILALLFAAPLCLFSAIHLTQYAGRRMLHVMMPVIDILAGIPSVVYGLWGVIVVVPFISKYSKLLLGIETPGYTILAGAIVLAIMIIPFILNVLIELLQTVPDEVKEASLSLGAGKWHTTKHVVLKKVNAGILASFGLGLSRAFGETMAVLMVVGNVAKVPSGLLQPGYPLPALIANNFGEMISVPLYDSALMMAALILLVTVLMFNFGSRLLIRHIEKQNAS